VSGQWWRVKTTGRRDGVEAGVVRALRDGGATVEMLGEPVDLLVGFRGVNHLVECKTDEAGLTPAQVKFSKRWTGAPPFIARNEAQAKKLIRMWSEPREGDTLDTPASGRRGT
jgi:hypothetical protein